MDIVCTLIIYYIIHNIFLIFLNLILYLYTLTYKKFKVDATQIQRYQQEKKVQQ